MTDSQDKFVPYRAEEFDTSVGIDGNIKFRDKSRMTLFARRRGGPDKGLFMAVWYFLAVAVVVVITAIFIPQEWSTDQKAWTIIGLCLAAFGGFLVILAFWFRARVMVRLLLGLAGLGALVYVAQSLASAAILSL